MSGNLFPEPSEETHYHESVQEDTTGFSEADELDAEDDVEQIKDFDMNEDFIPALDAALAAVRDKMIENVDDTQQRKAIPVNVKDRRAIRRRSVDTDVAISDLARVAILELLRDGAEIPVASAAAHKRRTEKITLTAPAYVWQLASLAATARGGSVSDVVSAAIGNYLP